MIPVPRLTNRSIGAQVAAHLEHLIMIGTLKPGERLPAERRLAERFGVSRASVREALAELESKNLVDRVQGRGSTVLDPMSNTRRLASMLEATDVALTNATELRESVEPSIAALAAERAKPTHIAALESIVGKESAETIGAEDSMKLDIQFHLLLAHATGNTLLLTVLRFSFKCTEQVRGRSHRTATGRRISLIGHRLILEAVKAHDAARAKEAMSRHLTDVRDVSALAA